MPISRRAPLWLLACMAVASLVGAANAETINVNLDQARVVKLPERVATIVIGNPLIADATLQNGGILIVTGKGYGATNILALDRQGRTVMDTNVQVAGPGTGDIVTVYKGMARESYSCSPLCAPRITLGDAPEYFASTLQATGTRNGQAQSTK